MSNTTTQFKKIVSFVQNTPEDTKRTIEEKLTLYALFKQATEGNVLGSRPSLLNLVERKKFDARFKLKGLDSQEAMQQYVTLVQSFQPQNPLLYSMNEK